MIVDGGGKTFVVSGRGGLCNNVSGLILKVLSIWQCLIRSESNHFAMAEKFSVPSRENECLFSSLISYVKFCF